MLRTILRGAVLAAPAAFILACLASDSPAVQRNVTIYQIQDTTSVGRVAVGSTDTVTTTGIITGVDSKPSGLGYYIQDPTGGAFSGVLVFTGSVPQFADSGLALQELRVDGGATANNLLMQMQADLLGVPVVRPAVTETTALGAAYLAGLACGFWKDEAEIAALWSRDRVFEPGITRDEAQSRLAAWKRAVERTLSRK